MHPLLSLAVSQPQLLLEHAAAYTGLAATELSQARQQWRRQALLGLAAAALLAVALTLAGVALLLRGSLPAQPLPAPWALWLVPLVPALIGAVCGWLCLQPPTVAAFAGLQAQLKADAALWRELSRA